MWQVPLGCPEAGIYPSPWTNFFKSIQPLNPKLGIRLWCLGTFKCSLHCSLKIFPEGKFRKGNGPVTSKLRALLSDLSQAIVAEA